MKCPTTGKTFGVGISIPNADALTGMTLTNNMSQCPHCGQMHTWSNKDVFYQP